jgi:hypothetical protein
LGVVAADDWFDEAVVVVVAAVEDGDSLGFGVDEDEELVAELVHRGDGVLLEHRLDVEALDLDHARVASGASEAVGGAAEDLLLLLGPGAQARLLLVLDRLPFGLVDDVVERLLVALEPVERALKVKAMGFSAAKWEGEARLWCSLQSSTVASV